QTGARKAEPRSGWPDLEAAERPFEPPLPPLANDRKRRTWRWLAPVTLVVAAGAGLSWGAPAPPPRRKVDTRHVRAGRRQARARVTATGTLSAVTTVQVGSQVSGRVHEIFVDFNSAVHKGEVLATLDPQLLEAAVDQARANYAGARGSLAKARVELVHASKEM